MRHQLVILSDARDDLALARGWYEEHRVGLGDEFVHAVEACLSGIAEDPLLYPTVHKRVRRAVLRRFPFLILYTVEGDRILVVAVFHASRDPRTWRQRV
jgi:plasmid stabilization system protein ParE